MSQVVFQRGGDQHGHDGAAMYNGRGEGDFPSFFPVTPIYPSSLPRAFW